MFRVLEVILLGGGSIGALSGWLLVRWLDSRLDRARGLARRRREFDEAHAPAAAQHPRVVPQPGGLPPPLPLPPVAGRCNYRSGGHVCSLPPGHFSEHECACSRIPAAHRFS